MGTKYGANVDWFLADHEPRHLIEMQAYYRLEPFGDAWVRTARIEAAIINQYAEEKVNPYDLIPNEDNRPKSDGDEASEAAAVNAQARSFVGL